MLLLLSLTHPNIAFTVNKQSQFMHCLKTDDWNAASHLLQYLSVTIDHGIVLYCNSLLLLYALLDEELVRDKDDFTSTSVYFIYIGRNPIS